MLQGQDERHGNKSKQGKQKFNRENSIIIPTAQMDEDETTKKNTFNNLNSKEKQAFNRIFQMGGFERQNSIVAGHRNNKKLSLSREPSMLKSRGGNMVTSTPMSTKHGHENRKNLKTREQSTLKSETALERQNSILAKNSGGDSIANKPMKEKQKLQRDQSTLKSKTGLERQNSIFAKNSEGDSIANKPVKEKQRLQRENSTLKPDTAFERQNSVIAKHNGANNVASNVQKEKQRLQREHSRLNTQPALERQASELNLNDHRRKSKKQKQKHTKDPPAINQIAPVERENSIIVRIGGQTVNNSKKHLKPPKIKKAMSIRSLQSEVIVETPNPVRLEDWATAIYKQSERQHKAVQRVGPWMHIFKKLKIPNPFKPKANSRTSRKSFRSYKTI